ncbi:MAG: sugar-binding protein [Bradymonadales bacterium]
MSRLSFWAMSIAILLLTQPCFAQDPERKGKGKPSDGVILNANATYTPDKQMLIDSNITEWRGVEEIAFGPLLSGEYEYDWTGLKDLSVKLRVSYGMEKLYFLIQVKDNAVVARRRPWKSDMVELWLLSETHPIKANKGLVGLSFDMGPLTEDQPPTLRWISVAKKGIPNILSATIKLHDGYDIEMAVPFSEFTTLSPVMEGSIRFCVIVRDWDQDDPNEDEVVMASCKANPKSSSKLKAADMG